MVLLPYSYPVRSGQTHRKSKGRTSATSGWFEVLADIFRTVQDVIVESMLQHRLCAEGNDNPDPGEIVPVFRTGAAPLCTCSRVSRAAFQLAPPIGQFHGLGAFSG